MYVRVVYHIQLFHVTRVNESCHVTQFSAAPVVVCVEELCHTYNSVMSHVWTSHVTHTIESCHACEWVTSRSFQLHQWWCALQEAITSNAAFVSHGVAVCCSVLQRVAGGHHFKCCLCESLCCSVLQCVAVCKYCLCESLYRSVVAVFGSVLQFVAVCAVYHMVLQRVAVCWCLQQEVITSNARLRESLYCSVVAVRAVCYSVLQVLKYITVGCSGLQCAVVCCSVLKYVAACCKKPSHPMLPLCVHESCPTNKYVICT